MYEIKIGSIWESDRGVIAEVVNIILDVENGSVHAYIDLTTEDGDDTVMRLTAETFIRTFELRS